MSKGEKLYSPGEPAPESGQYVQTGPRGGNPSGTEITAVKGKPLPPTGKPDNKWRLVDPTRHK